MQKRGNKKCEKDKMTFNALTGLAEIGVSCISKQITSRSYLNQPCIAPNVTLRHTTDL